MVIILGLVRSSHPKLVVYLDSPLAKPLVLDAKPSFPMKVLFASKSVKRFPCNVHVQLIKLKFGRQILQAKRIRFLSEGSWTALRP